MKFLVYSGFDSESIKISLGQPEYSYYFVLVSFAKLLARFGEVVEVQHPHLTVDPLYDECRLKGEDCVFLCFAPPQIVPITLRCPTIPVIAWEFNTIPCEAWGDDPRSDWRVVFRHCGRVITLSHHTEALVREAMGADFPVFAIPTASFDDFEDIAPRSEPRLAPRELALRGFLLDSFDLAPKPPAPLAAPADEAMLHALLQRLAQDEIEAERRAKQEIEDEIRHQAEAEAAAAAEAERLRQEEAEARRAAEEAARKQAEAEAAEAERLRQIAAQTPPPRPDLRARLSMTASYFGYWYRDVVRDLLPRPIAGLLAALAVAVNLLYRLVFRGRPVESAEAAPVAAPIMIQPPPTPEPESLAMPEPEPAIVAIMEPVIELEPVIEPEPAPPPLTLPPPPPVTIKLGGVVYVSVLSPQDGRKNWSDMLTAFVWAFRDQADCTLLLKLPLLSAPQVLAEMEVFLAQLAPFRCRILLMSGFLDRVQYRALIDCATYYVNSSVCEGLCLPLMEFLSAGKPAIAPNHTAMADYLQPDFAFLLRSSIEHNVWPHDPRNFFTTTRYRLDWSSLVEAYQASYRLARAEDGAAYGGMANKAKAAMRRFCGGDAVVERLCNALPPLAATAPIRRREVAE